MERAWINPSSRKAKLEGGLREYLVSWHGVLYRSRDESWRQAVAGRMKTKSARNFCRQNDQGANTDLVSLFSLSV